MARRFKSRQVFMEESLNEFCDYTYENASLNRIIKNSGASKGSFYYHFENKESLYQTLLEESVKAKWAFINDFTKEQSGDFHSMDLFDQFLFQAKAGLIFAEKEPKYAKLATMFSKEKGTPIYDKMIGIIGGDATEMLRQMIAKAYEKGEINRQFSLEFVTQVLVKLFSDYDVFFYEEDSLDRNLSKLDEFVRFMKEGFGSKP